MRFAELIKKHELLSISFEISFLPISPSSDGFLRIELNDDKQWVLLWVGNGFLYGSETVNGPYHEISGAQSPFPMTASKQMFFKLLPGDKDSP